jgi:1,2-phenylacetyl-CoA epoxidase catalytic subunit
MRWVLQVPQIIETADDMSKEQLVEQLIKQQMLHGAADTFILEPITEWCGDDTKIDVGNEQQNFEPI